MTRQAVIVSTARTPIGRAYRGIFNSTPAPTLASHALRAAVQRARVDAAEVEDCILGCALPQGTQHTIGRTAALRAGLPASVAGMTIDRQCSSGLMRIATAAKQIVVDHMQIVVAGGVESISLAHRRAEPDPTSAHYVPHQKETPPRTPYVRGGVSTPTTGPPNSTEAT